MFYQSGKMELECIRTVFQGNVNDVYICKDCNVKGDIPYTLLVIKDHKIARKYLEVFEEAGNKAENSYVERFSDKGCFCMLFEYRKERPLKDFYMGESISLEESEEICIRFILQCMESCLPYPVLYMIMQQGQIHLARDRSIYFSYYFDLEKLDEKKKERDCAILCASLLKELLKSKVSSKGFAYRVLEKKVRRESYERFVELYRDLKLTATPKKEKGLGKKLGVLLGKYRDFFLRIFFIICIFIIFLALLSLISQMLFGDIPWLRLIINGFKKIGTESLLK